MDEQQHVALPRLMGAPAYARPPRLVEERERPFDPDDMPISAVQTDEERRLLDELPARAYAPGGGVVLGATAAPDREDGELEAGPFRLRALAARLLGGD